MSDAPELQMSDGPKHDQSDGRTNDGATASTGQAAPAARQNRRALPRRRVERLAYIRFDKDNGGILLDIGEGGLKFQGVASSLEGEFCIVKFMLPGSGRTIEVRGQIAWSNKSRKGGGVRFLDVPEDVRQQIREWMAQENTPLISTRPVSKPIVSKPPQFLTRERVKAGMTPPPSSQPAMPSLSSAPSVPVEPIVPAAPSVRIASVPVAGVRVEDGVVVSSLPTEPIVPAAKNLDSVVASATAEVPSALGPPSVLAPIRISVPPQAVGGERSEMPALFAEDVRNTKSAKSLPSRFRGITQPAATQLPTQLSAQTPQTSDWSHPATVPHSESFIAADLGALKYGQPTGISRVAQIAVVAAFVCVASVAAVVVTPRAPALLASFRGISQASTSAPVDAPAPDVTAGQDFSVDAVNSANRHWTLRNGAADDSAVASMGSAPNGAPNVSPNAGENAADDISNTPSSDVPGNLSSNANARGGAKVSAAQPSEANRIVPGEPRTKSFVPASAAQHLNLTPPKTRQVAALSSGLEAPSVVDNPLSANSLDSPLALGTHSLPAPPPVAPAPSAPATAAVASASKSALRPAVLIHSVRAVYPRDVSPSKSGSSVRVSAVIDKDGVPGSLTMVGGDPSFLGAALAAVREYRYDPALINGEPVESTVVIAVNFQQTR